MSPAPWLVSAHGCYRCLPRFSHAPCSVSGADRRDPEAAAQRRRQREEERENALMLARRSLRARVRDMVLSGCGGAAAQPLHGRPARSSPVAGIADCVRVSSSRVQGLEPVAESTAEMELRLRWAEEARAEAEKRRIAREQAIAEARARGDGTRTRKTQLLVWDRIH